MQALGKRAQLVYRAPPSHRQCALLSLALPPPAAAAPPGAARTSDLETFNFWPDSPPLLWSEDQDRTVTVTVPADHTKLVRLLNQSMSFI